MIKKCKMSSHFKLFNVVDVNIIFPSTQIVCTIYFFIVADNFWILMPDVQSCPGPALDQVSDQESRLSRWILSCARIEIFLAKTRFQLSSIPRCAKQSGRSLDASKGSPDIPN